MKFQTWASILLAAAFAAAPVHSQAAHTAGKSYFGLNGYIEYVAGNSPLILVAPHGGTLVPSGMDSISPHSGDGGSRQTTLSVAAIIVRKTGKYPHIVINHIKSNRLNAAREKEAAAGSNLDAQRAWEEFHGFLESAKATVVQQWKKGHYLEIHTNGHPERWNEVGLGVSGSALNLGDSSILGRAGKSTIRHLVEAERASMLEVVKGPTSLGGLLMSRGYASVPSPAYPKPGEGGYFYAGWNTWRHGSRDSGTIDATHLECRFTL